MPDATQLSLQRQSRIRLLDKCKAYQWAIREAGPHITPLEFRLLIVVVDRTWGRMRTRVTLLKETLASATGCNCSLRAITRAQRRLVDLEIMDIIPTGRGHSFAPKVGTMITSKRHRGIAKTPIRNEAASSHSGRPDRPLSPPPNSIDNDTRDSGKRSGERTLPKREPATPDPLPVVQAIGEVAGAMSTPPTPNKSSRKHTELWKTWRRAHAEPSVGVDCPEAWAARQDKTKEKGAHWAGKLAEVWPADDTPGLHDFLYWCVLHWDEIMAGEAFNWMKPKQLYANIRFIFTHHERFYNAWKGKAKEDWRHGPHADEIDMLRGEGKIKEAEALMRKTDG